MCLMWGLFIRRRVMRSEIELGLFRRAFISRSALATLTSVTAVAVARAALTTFTNVVVGLWCLDFCACRIVKWQGFWVAVFV